MAEYNGALLDVSAIDLGVARRQGGAAPLGVEPAEIDHVDLRQRAADLGRRDLRRAPRRARRPASRKEVPALTRQPALRLGLRVDRPGQPSGSSLGEATTVLAGGMENMSQAPHVIRGARERLKLGQGQLEDSLMVALLDSYCGLYMAQTSDRVARASTGSRARSRTTTRCARRRARPRPGPPCRLSEEVVPVEVKAGRRRSASRRTTTCAPTRRSRASRRCRPSFGKDGSVTAGNASGIVDGAAARGRHVGARTRRRRAGSRSAGWCPGRSSACEPRAHGPRPRAGGARGARTRGSRARKTSTSGRSTRPSPGQILGVVRELGLDLANVERQRRRDRARPSARRHRARACTLTLLKELRRRGTRYGAGGGLHRRRPGHRRRRRVGGLTHADRALVTMNWTERILDFPVRAAAVDDFCGRCGPRGREI